MTGRVVNLRPALPIPFDRYQRRVARKACGFYARMDGFREAINDNIATMRARADDPYVVEMCQHNIGVIKNRWRLHLSAMRTLPRIEWPGTAYPYHCAAE